MDETRYITRALTGNGTGWEATALGDLAALAVPDSILGRPRSLLRADIGGLWATWFVESLSDPRRFVGRDVSYAHLFQEVLGAVTERFGLNTTPERQALASSASSILQRSVDFQAARSNRQPITRDQKSFLIDVAGEAPRCWICGGLFDPVAVDNFVYSDRKSVSLPLFLDVLCPRGLAPQDVAIQVDHIVPVSRGGADKDNLALACGWCNRYKSAFLSIYDVDGRPRSPGPNKLGITSLPQPFWSVRHIATVRQCEHPGGCDRTASSSPMTIAPHTLSGALNPTNLRVTCLEHDPLRNLRLQSPDVVRALWGKDV